MAWWVDLVVAPVRAEYCGSRIGRTANGGDGEKELSSASHHVFRFFLSFQARERKNRKPCWELLDQFSPSHLCVRLGYVTHLAPLVDCQQTQIGFDRHDNRSKRRLRRDDGLMKNDLVTWIILFELHVKTSCDWYQGLLEASILFTRPLAFIYAATGSSASSSTLTGLAPSTSISPPFSLRASYFSTFMSGSVNMTGLLSPRTADASR